VIISDYKMVAVNDIILLRYCYDIILERV